MVILADSRQTFDQLLSKSVEISLKKILGQVAGETLLQKVERQFRLKRNDIPSRIEEFTRALETVLGPRSASIVADFLMLEFCSKLGLKYERKGYTCSLVDEIEEARKRVGEDIT